MCCAICVVLVGVVVDIVVVRCSVVVAVVGICGV